MKVLLCIDNFPAGLLERFKSLAPEHEYTSCSPESVIDRLDGVDIIIPSVCPITASIIEAGEFGLIHQLGVGLDTVDIETSTRAGVLVARTPGAGTGNAESVSEHAVLLILALSRNLNQCQENIRKGLLFKPTGRALWGKRVCLLGFGDIGKAIAKRLQPFEVHLTVVRQRPDQPAQAEYCVEKAYGVNDLKTAVSEADYLILALPGSDATYHIINEAVLESCKPGAYLINIGRGSLIDSPALVAALASKRLAGAALDVFEEEPVNPDDELFKYNVIATPHVAAVTDVSFAGVTRYLIENVQRFARGEAVLNTVNEPTEKRKRK